MITPARKAKKIANFQSCYKPETHEEVLTFSENMTPVAREFVGLIGMEKTLKLIDQFGGKSLVFPIHINGIGARKFKELADVIGECEVMKLRRHYGDFKVYIPFCTHAFTAVKHKRIVSTYDQLIKELSGNDAVRELSDAYGVCERSIEQILNSPQ